eukprot:163351_1
MDSLHFYVFHLFDCGLRTIIGNDIDEDNDEIKQDKQEYFDVVFARVTKMINDRKYITSSFARFRNNNKFNMAIDKIDSRSNSGKKGITFMDEFYEYLSHKNIDDTVVNAFRNIIMLEEYDSETMAYDVDDINYTSKRPRFARRIIIVYVVESIILNLLCNGK